MSSTKTTFTDGLRDAWRDAAACYEDPRNLGDKDFLKPFLVHTGTAAFGSAWAGRIAPNWGRRALALPALLGGLVSGGTELIEVLVTGKADEHARRNILSTVGLGGSTGLNLLAMSALKTMNAPWQTRLALSFGIGFVSSFAMGALGRPFSPESTRESWAEIAIGSVFAGINTLIGVEIGRGVEALKGIHPLLRYGSEALIGVTLLDLPSSVLEWGVRFGLDLKLKDTRFSHFLARNIGSGIAGTLAPAVLRHLPTHSPPSPHTPHAVETEESGLGLVLKPAGGGSPYKSGFRANLGGFDSDRQRRWWNDYRAGQREQEAVRLLHDPMQSNGKGNLSDKAGPPPTPRPVVHMPPPLRSDRLEDIAAVTAAIARHRDAGTVWTPVYPSDRGYTYTLDQGAVETFPAIARNFLDTHPNSRVLILTNNRMDRDHLRTLFGENTQGRHDRNHPRSLQTTPKRRRVVDCAVFAGACPVQRSGKGRGQAISNYFFGPRAIRSRG